MLRVLSRQRTPRPTDRLGFVERLNFLVTNRIPRIPLTHLVGWLSRIENRWVAATSIALWRACVDDLRLFEARTRRFTSLGACFSRELKPGVRPIDPDPDILVSPCDAVVGEHGRVRGSQVFQAKGFPYSLPDLFGDSADSDGLAERHRDGYYVTLRLKSSMYHRFHAPTDGRVGDIRYISGDTWNVNPVALRIVERLFCKNERVVFRLRIRAGHELALVAVAAVLVASVRIRGLDEPLNLRYRGPNELPYDREVRKGEELGYFELGSTIVMFAPAGYRLSAGITNGRVIRMGQALLEPASE